jgi:hypothetical protein
MTKQEIKTQIIKSKLQHLRETGKRAGKKEIIMIAKGLIELQKFLDNNKTDWAVDRRK